ncbi:MAG: hypothetical protein GXP00_05530 [Alphaproteobacteria bacterium]|nr:hypothetical protein [Alphaproteobacteria bacterium]
MSLLMQDFDYHRPTSFEELSALVSDCQKGGRAFAFSAGGTDIIPQLKSDTLHPDCLISLGGLKDLNHIEKRGNRLIIGSLTTLHDLANNDLIRDYLPALAHAAHKVASPQIRNRATIGGNIMVDNRCIYINQSEINRECHAPCFKADGDVCHLVKSAKRGDDILCQARFVSDTAPILLLLGARIAVMGAKGGREMALNDLYLRDGIDNRSLEVGDIITAIEVDIPEDDTALHYEKLTIRNALDFPSLGVGVRMTDGAVSVALTGLNTLPGLFHAKPGDFDNFDDMIDHVCAEAMDFAKTYNQDFFPRHYRKNMIPVFIRRGLDKIIKDKS